MTELGEWGANDAALAVDTAPADAGEEDREAAGAPSLYFSSLETWVTQWLSPTYRRSLGGHHTAWCPQWWRHAEAIARLEALWRSWEHLRLDPATGMSVWFRDHCDPHMTVLLSADGPFKGCSPQKGHREHELEPMPIDPAPPGTF